MKLITLFLFFVSIQSFGQDRLFVFPEPIDTASINNCRVRDFDFRKKIELSKFGADTAYFEYSKVSFLDINGDGQCEIIHYFLNRIMGVYDFLTIYKIKDSNELKELGTFTNWNFTFAKSENEYLAIIEGYFKGHKTNPVYFSKVYEFDGSKYVASNIPEVTKDEYERKGLALYNEKKYEEASKYFWNALRTPHHDFIDELKDANNLAIAWIKTGKNEEAISLLENYITQFDQKYYDAKELAPSYFNLGLAEENLQNHKKAKDYFLLSCKYKKTEACIKKTK